MIIRRGRVLYFSAIMKDLLGCSLRIISMGRANSIV